MWTAADGRRGRRWRATTHSPHGRLDHALLLEVSPDGRPVRLELASTDGLLTVHPDPDDRWVHGNVVTVHGVRHLAFPWTPASQLLVAGSPVTAAVAARRLGRSIGVGEGATFAALEVRRDLDVLPATWRAARVGERSWRLLPAGGGEVIPVDLDPGGVPGGPELVDTWPLELEVAVGEPPVAGEPPGRGQRVDNRGRQRAGG